MGVLNLLILTKKQITSVIHALFRPSSKLLKHEGGLYVTKTYQTKNRSKIMLNSVTSGVSQQDIDRLSRQTTNAVEIKR